MIAGMPACAAAPPSHPPETRIGFKPRTANELCTSSRRCSPRKASTSTASTARPGHAAAGARPRHRAAQHGPALPRRARPRAGRRRHAARRRSHRRRDTSLAAGILDQARPDQEVALLVVLIVNAPPPDPAAGQCLAEEAVLRPGAGQHGQESAAMPVHVAHVLRAG